MCTSITKSVIGALELIIFRLYIHTPEMLQVQLRFFQNLFCFNSVCSMVSRAKTCEGNVSAAPQGAIVTIATTPALLFFDCIERVFETVKLFTFDKSCNILYSRTLFYLRRKLHVALIKSTHIWRHSRTNLGRL